MEYINTLVATNSVRTTPKDIPNKDDLIKKGVDFTDNKPTFVIDIPTGGAIVRNVKVPSSNIEEIEVIFTTESGRELAPIRGAPTSLPTDKFPAEKVSEIIVKVIKTTDGKAPQDVTLSVIACAEGVTTGRTTSPGKISTLTPSLSPNTIISSRNRYNHTFIGHVTKENNRCNRNFRHQRYYWKPRNHWKSWNHWKSRNNRIQRNHWNPRNNRIQRNHWKPRNHGKPRNNGIQRNNRNSRHCWNHWNQRYYRNNSEAM